MSIISNVMNAARALVASGTQPEIRSYGVNWGNDADLYGGENLSGVDITQNKALEMSAYWAAVDIISGDIAKLPFQVFKNIGSEDGREVAKTSPAWRLLERSPNKEMTPFVFKKALAFDAVQGNGYAFVSRDNSGSPSGLIKLSASSTNAVWVTDKNGNKDLWYVTTTSGGHTVWMAANEVIHIKGMSLDGITGMTVWDQAKQSLGLAYSAQGFGAKFFANNGSGGVIIQVPTKMSEAARDNLRNSWNSKHASMTNSHRTAVLEEGVTIEQFKMNANDAQLLSTREFSIVDIANWFRMPAHKLGSATRTSYSSLEAENQSYLDTCLDPWLVSFEQEFMQKLLTPAQLTSGNVIIEADRSVLLRADSKTRMENDVKGVSNGIFTRNEVRVKRNLNPIEGLDVITIPLNLSGVTADETDETEAEGPDAETEPVATEGDDGTEANRAMLRATFDRVVRRWSSMYVKTARSDKHKDPIEIHIGDLVKQEESFAQELLPYCRAAGVDYLQACNALRELYIDNLDSRVDPETTAQEIRANVAQDTIEKLGV